MTERGKVPPAFADLTHEGELLGAGARLVAGMDEVGRGALAGPVSVGVCVVDASSGGCPVGLTDSKVLTARARTEYLPLIDDWALAHAVGSASSAEIDALGIIRALRLAGQRALTQVALVVGPVDTVLLDGSHDWLTAPEPDLLSLLDGIEGIEDTDGIEDTEAPAPHGYLAPRVHTRVKADLACASVAAASVVAKCARDAEMTALAQLHPEYGWVANKGYGSAQHIAALTGLGPSPLHRLSWKLPGVAGAAGQGVDGP